MVTKHDNGSRRLASGSVLIVVNSQRSRSIFNTKWYTSEECIAEGNKRLSVVVDEACSAAITRCMVCGPHCHHFVVYCSRIFADLGELPLGREFVSGSL